MRKIILTVLILILLVVAGIGWGRPWYNGVRERRALEQTRQWLAEGKSDHALITLRQALRLNPENVEACEMMAEFAEATGSAAALQWRKRVAELAPDLTNQLKLAACSLRFESAPFSLAQQALRNSATAGQSNVTYHTLASELAIVRNQSVEAEYHLEHATRFDPTNALHHVKLSVLRLQSKDARTAAEARQHLQNPGLSPPLRLIALRSLVADSRNRRERERAEQLAEALVGVPGSAYSDRLTHLSVAWENQSDRYSAVMQEARAHAETNAVTTAQLCGWMTEAGVAAEAIVWSESLPASIRQQRPVQVAIARCYLRQKDWKNLENYIHEQQWGDLDFMRLAWLSRALEEQGDKTGRKLFWNKAARLVTENPALTSLLAQTADDWGWNLETEELLWSVLKSRPGDAWAAPALARLYQATGNTRGLLKLYTTLFSRNPSDPILKNNLAMSQFLLKTNLSTAHDFSSANYRANPENSGFVATYAFSLWLQQKSADALQVMRTLKPEVLEQPSTAAYFGEILASTGEKDEAQRYLALASQAPLLPEEKELIRSALIGNP